MDPVHAEHAVAGLLVATLVVTGIFGVLAPTPEPTVGEGDATVQLLSDPAPELHVTPGRFGADVAYLRLPALSVSIDDLTGHPELLYEVRVPALDVETRERRVLGAGSEGTRRLHLADRARSRAALDRGPFRGRVIVRLQSFSTERTLVNRTVTVEVAR